MRLSSLFAVCCLVSGAPPSSEQHVAFEHAVVSEQDPGVAPQVTTAELRGLIALGRAVILDARPAEEYGMSHIPGALNVSQKAGTPMSFYISDVAEVKRLVPDRDRPVVVYCNGPFCGKSRRLAEELVAARYRTVRRYQLGMPGWRTAGGVSAIEAPAIRRVAELDRTAVFVDAGLATSPHFLPRMVRLHASDVVRAKDDGRLPMHDHNTRMVVLARSGPAARALAETIAANAFHNVAFFDGDASRLGHESR